MLKCAQMGARPPPDPCGWRHPGGGSPRRPGAGRANGCADRGRARTAPDAKRAPRAVWWWGMRAPGRSRPPRPRPPPKRRPRQPARRPASPCQSGGVLVRRRRQRPAPRRRAGGRASGAAAHALGGLRRSARASWSRPAARGGRGADGQRRWPQPRSRRARAWGARVRPWPRRKTPRGGPCGPPRCARRAGRREPCSRPSKTKRRREPLVAGGASLPRRSPPWGGSSPHGSPREPG